MIPDGDNTTVNVHLKQSPLHVSLLPKRAAKSRLEQLDLIATITAKSWPSSGDAKPAGFNLFKGLLIWLLAFDVIMFIALGCDVYQQNYFDNDFVQVT